MFKFGIWRLLAKLAQTIFMKFCGFIQHSNLNNMTLSTVPGKSLKLRKFLILILYMPPNVATKPTDQSCPDSMFRVPLQMLLAHFFHFRFTLQIKGSLHKKQAKELSEKHRILQT